MGRLKQQFKTTISLEAAGTLDTHNADLWKEAYLCMSPLTVTALPMLSKLGIQKDQEDLTGDQLNAMLPLLQKAFISGKVVLDAELVDATPEDMEDLPLVAMNGVIGAVMGQPDPKSSENLNE